MKSKSPIAALVAFFLAALTAFPALAEPAVATRNVNIRSGPGLNFEVVDTLVQGEPVDKGQCNADGSWCYIKHEGSDGWVAAVFIRSTTFTPPTVEPQHPPLNSNLGGSTYTTTAALNVRSGPGTSFAVVDTLSSGQQVKRGECTDDGSWCYVEHEGTAGWVAARYLRAPGSRPQPTPPSGDTTDTYFARSPVNVRSGPGTQFSIVDRLQGGEKVNREQCTSDEKWCYVTHDGPDGWVSANYLRSAEERPQPPQRPQPGNNDILVGTAITGMPVRARPTLFSSTVGRIERGDVVEIDQCNDAKNWCHINEPDLKGWVPEAFMDISKPQTRQPDQARSEALTKQSVVMRAGPGQSYNVIGFVPANQKVTIERCNFGGDWCQITRGDRRGWIEARFLAAPRDAQPAAGNQPDTICFTGFGGIRICLGEQN